MICMNSSEFTIPKLKIFELPIQDILNVNYSFFKEMMSQQAVKFSWVSRKTYTYNACSQNINIRDLTNILEDDWVISFWFHKLSNSIKASLEKFKQDEGSYCETSVESCGKTIFQAIDNINTAYRNIFTNQTSNPFAEIKKVVSVDCFNCRSETFYHKVTLKNDVLEECTNLEEFMENGYVVTLEKIQNIYKLAFRHPTLNNFFIEFVKFTFPLPLDTFLESKKKESQCYYL